MTLEDFSEAFRKFQKEYPAAVAHCLLDDSTHLRDRDRLCQHPAQDGGHGKKGLFPESSDLSDHHLMKKMTCYWGSGPENPGDMPCPWAPLR